MQELISIIVPVYNVEKYIDRCVNSIRKQTYRNIEIILVDDGSTDSSGTKCDELAKEDNRIRVIHKVNGGLSAARNVGIEAAKGRYIGFVDSDDWIELDMYETLWKYLNDTSADLAVTGINRVYDNGYSVDRLTRNPPMVLHDEDIIKGYLSQNIFSTAAWDKLYRRELLAERRFPVGKLYEDAPVIFDILCSIHTLAVVGIPQYHYFQRADSICGKAFSRRKMDHYYFSKEIWERVYRDYPELKNEADVFWGCKLSEIIYSLHESNNRKEFSEEEYLLYREFNKVKKKVFKSKTVPFQIRMKAIVASVHAVDWYIKFKALKVKKG